MKKLTLAAIGTTALLGLAACSEANAPEAEDTVMDTAAPIATETVESTDDGDSLSVNEDGMSVDINDGDTSVSAEVGENPSASVTTD